MNMMVKNSIFAAMDAGESSSKNLVNIKTMFRLEKPRTFYKILNF